MKNNASMKIKIALLFGGKSTEHDISVISALQAYNNINKEKYDVYPIYVTRENELFWGDRTGDIKAYRNVDCLIKSSVPVALVRRADRVKLVRVAPKLFEKAEISDIDVAFPVVHGTNTEDGTLQGFCQLLDLPYVGCDVLSSAVGMDKYLTKIVLRDAGIPVLDAVRIAKSVYDSAPESEMDKIEERFGYPVIVKPINCGSSIGISKASDREGLSESLSDAFNYAELVVVERAITKLREINCSVVGDSRGAKASECEEPIGSDEILSFNDKYVAGAKGGAKSGGSKGASSGMASLKRKIPAPISDETREYIRETAKKAFLTLGCSGVSRIDFLMDGETGEIFFNEINTIPGSLSFYLWEPLGVRYPELLDELISLALAGYRRRASLTYSFKSSVLQSADFSGSKGTKGGKA